MTELKTQKNDASVEEFLNEASSPEHLDDSFTILKLMREVTGEKAAMWGTSIVGFGSYSYTYASGRSGDWPLTGFSPRKRDFSIYIMSGFESHSELMAKLGRHKHGKSCLYIRRLADIDQEVLKELVRASVEKMKQKNV